MWFMWVATCGHMQRLAGVFTCSTFIFLCVFSLEERRNCRSDVICLSSPHRLLVVLESLAGLLISADLLATLPLDVTLLHLLQQEVGPAQPVQHRVGRVRRQEH